MFVEDSVVAATGGAMPAEASETVHAVRPSLKCVVYGDAGAGKSTFAATWPTPILVLAFDPIGKDMPYLKRGKAQAMGKRAIGINPSTGAAVTVPVRKVVSPKGKLLVQIEHYIDSNPREPQAYPKFQARFNELHEEYDIWKTVVFDSVTFLELAARKYHQYALNPTTKNPLQWFGGATDLLEELLMIQVGAMPCHVVIVCHIDEDKDEVNGVLVRNPKAPGRLGKGKGLSAAMVEVYRAFVGRDDRGQSQYMLQTASDSIFNCATRIDAPNPSAPQYKALWVNNTVRVGGEVSDKNIAE